MASGFFILLDDIAALMDDVAVMAKVATKKTAGILGDDLAVNAEKASGFVSSREIPVLWAITKGSALNKLMILPVAFLLSAYVPWLVTVILVLGGVYLAYEGVEKIYEFFVPHEEDAGNAAEDKEQTEEEILAHEKVKVKSAIVTDFILSVEIVIIALSTVVEKPIMTQVMVVSIVAIIATVGVYGIVAFIVRMDDMGYALIRKSKTKKGVMFTIGTLLVKALPWIIRSLAVIGTIALLLVAGGIFGHNIHFLHDILHGFPSIIKDFILGLAGGGIALVLVTIFKRIRK